MSNLLFSVRAVPTAPSSGLRAHNCLIEVPLRVHSGRAVHVGDPDDRSGLAICDIGILAFVVRNLEVVRRRGEELSRPHKNNSC